LEVKSTKDTACGVVIEFV